MLVIVEVSILVASVLGVIGLKKLLSKVGVKISKRKLKKILFNGFSIIDIDMIKTAIVGLKDYDKKYNTEKLEKYIQEILKENKYNKETPDFNEENVKLSLNDFNMLENIFDETEEEKKDIEDVVDVKLTEIEKRRKEIIIRKNEIKNQIQGKNRRMMRKSGGMG